MWNKENGLDSKVINKAIKILRQSDLFEYIYESTRVIEFNLNVYVYNKLIQRLMIDKDNMDIIVFQFYKIIKDKSILAKDFDDKEFRLRSAKIILLLNMIQLLSAKASFRYAFATAYKFLYRKLNIETKVEKVVKFFEFYNTIVRNFRYGKLYESYNILHSLGIRRLKETSLSYKKGRIQMFYKILFGNLSFLFDVVSESFKILR